MSGRLLPIVLLGALACANDRQAFAAVDEPVTLDAEVPPRALQRVLWLVRAQASRGAEHDIRVLVHEKGGGSQDAPEWSLPTSYVDLIASEPGFAVVPQEAPCPDEIRIVLVGTASRSDTTFAIALDEYDFRRDSRAVWNQVYAVACNNDYCEVTDIHLGEEPDISIEWADPSVCEERRRAR